MEENNTFTSDGSSDLSVEIDTNEPSSGLSELLLDDNNFDDYLVEGSFPRIGHKKLLLNARRVIQSEIGREFILLAIEEIKEK